MTYKGSCHCGKIAFEADGDIKEVLDCNCSICGKRGYLHWFLPHDKVRFKTPVSNLATYTFKTGKYKHQFCLVGERRFASGRQSPLAKQFEDCESSGPQSSDPGLNLLPNF